MSDACCGAADCGSPSPVRPAWWLDRKTQILGASGVLLALASVAEWLSWPGLVIPASAAVILATIREPLRNAWVAARARVLDINVLMVMAVAGAVALGEWAEAAAVVWLFALAHRLESSSLSRAREAVRKLLALTPATATVRRTGPAGEIDVPVDRVEPGDLVVIRPGARVPVDGEVVRGTSALNQAPITGESMPVDKGPGDDVFAGSVNGHGALEMVATRRATESTISRIARLVEAAQQRRAPIQTVVDRFARRYTPAVLMLAVLVAIVPAASGLSAAPAETWLYRALALLVVACPCALVISTPVSIVSALTSAARHGVVIKGGASLERLASVRCVAFDKTGTLTHGRVAVTGVRAVGGFEAGGVLALAAALESSSEHPIGRAIVTHARASGLTPNRAEDYRALPGLGAEARVDAELAVVGSHRLFEERALCTPELHDTLGEVERDGANPVLVGHGRRALGVIGLADENRSEGRDAVRRLRDAGILRVALLTGDGPASARAAREAHGLDEAHASLMPADKVLHIERLRQAYGPVAMVGDGINDAPALATADVGVAMGTGGTDVALETADVALLGDDLTKLPYAIGLGRLTVANIRQNVGIALGLKVAFVGLAVAGMATMWMAVVADTGASVLVIANSLRLLRHHPAPALTNASIVA